MLFLHVFADFNLQGILASMKQKTWWADNAFNDIDRIRKITTETEFKRWLNITERSVYDYVVSLMIHAFSWTYVIMFPIMCYEHFQIDIDFIIAFLLTWTIHAIVDYLKANAFLINLVMDQFIHVIQVSVLFFIFIQAR
jgi:hypothetical protein